METSFPRGTVRYMEVGLSSGAQANSARLSEGTRMPSRRRGPWHTGSTGRGTLLWDSHRRRLRRRQSQAHLKHWMKHCGIGLKICLSIIYRDSSAISGFDLRWRQRMTYIKARDHCED